MVNKHETIYFIISISDKRLSSFLISLILSLFFLLIYYFFPTFFVLILSYLSGTCTFFFDDISGRNFLSSFGHFWAEPFFPGGGGGGGGGGVHMHPLHSPPPYAPASRIIDDGVEVHIDSSGCLKTFNHETNLVLTGWCCP